jgi:hypothetical protein
MPCIKLLPRADKFTTCLRFPSFVGGRGFLGLQILTNPIQYIYDTGYRIRDLLLPCVVLAGAFAFLKTSWNFSLRHKVFWLQTDGLILFRFGFVLRP